MDFQSKIPSVELIKNHFNGLDFKKNNMDNKDSKKLKETCRDFESILLNQMLSAMRKSIPKSGLFKKSLGMDIYESMYDQYLSKEIAQEKGIGIKEMLYKELNNQDRIKK